MLLLVSKVSRLMMLLRMISVSVIVHNKEKSISFRTEEKCVSYCKGVKGLKCIDMSCLVVCEKNTKVVAVM